MSIVARWAWYIVLGYLAAAILPLAILYWMLTPGSCTSETLAKFSNLSGFDFEVSYKDCDIIAKQVWIAYLSPRAPTREKPFCSGMFRGDRGARK